MSSFEVVEEKRKRKRTERKRRSVVKPLFAKWR